jgi:hypothetical protein
MITIDEPRVLPSAHLPGETLTVRDVWARDGRWIGRILTQPADRGSTHRYILTTGTEQAPSCRDVAAATTLEAAMDQARRWGEQVRLYRRRDPDCNLLPIPYSPHSRGSWALGIGG